MMGSTLYLAATAKPEEPETSETASAERTADEMGKSGTKAEPDDKHFDGSVD